MQRGSAKNKKKLKKIFLKLGPVGLRPLRQPASPVVLLKLGSLPSRCGLRVLTISLGHRTRFPSPHFPKANKVRVPSGCPLHFTNILQPLSYLTLSTILSEKAMAPHSSTFAWKIPWMEEPGGLQSTGSLRVGHD